jgi:hypothetical protein
LTNLLDLSTPIISNPVEANELLRGEDCQQLGLLSHVEVQLSLLKPDHLPQNLHGPLVGNLPEARIPKAIPKCPLGLIDGLAVPSEDLHDPLEGSEILLRQAELGLNQPVETLLHPAFQFLSLPLGPWLPHLSPGSDGFENHHRSQEEHHNEPHHPSNS